MKNHLYLNIYMSFALSSGLIVCCHGSLRYTYNGRSTNFAGSRHTNWPQLKPRSPN